RFEKIIREIREYRKQKVKAGKESGRKRRERKEFAAEQVLDSVPVLFEQNANKNEPSFSFSSSASISEEKKEEGAQSQAIGPTRSKRDSRLDRPGVKAVHAVTGKHPPKDLWEAIIEIVGDQPNEVLMKKCWVAWRSKGFSPMNFGWLFEWYV